MSGNLLVMLVIGVVSGVIVAAILCVTFGRVKEFFKRIVFSKELCAAFIGAAVLIGGYSLNAIYERESQLRQNKAEAYSNFLNEMELNMKTSAELDNESTSTFNNEKRKLNAAFAVMETTAPSCVIQDIRHEVFNDGNNTIITAPKVSEMEAILHNDLYGYKNCTSTEVSSSSFMIFFLK